MGWFEFTEDPTSIDLTINKLRTFFINLRVTLHDKDQNLQWTSFINM